MIIRVRLFRGCVIYFPRYFYFLGCSIHQYIRGWVHISVGANQNKKISKCTESLGHPL